MKYAFVFPGQGSQTIGMGKELFLRFPEAKHLFQEVDDALHQSLSKLMFEGDLEDLTLTSNCQPALMAVSMAVVVVMEKLGWNINEVSCVAGHSLGEYAALAASGALSVTDTARLLRLRGEAMQKAVPSGQGGMVAVIGADFVVAETIAQEASAFGICEVANDNAPGQVILSGEKKALEQVPILAEKHNVRKVIPLNVSAPFHSSLMAPAAEIMRQALDDVEMCTPRVPLIPNVTAQGESKPDIIKNLLVRQITGRVRWRETVLQMEREGIAHIFEIGSGKVLAGLIKRIAPSISVNSVHTPEEIEETLKMMERIV